MNSSGPGPFYLAVGLGNRFPKFTVTALWSAMVEISNGSWFCWRVTDDDDDDDTGPSVAVAELAKVAADDADEALSVTAATAAVVLVLVSAAMAPGLDSRASIEPEDDEEPASATALVTLVVLVALDPSPAITVPALAASPAAVLATVWSVEGAPIMPAMLPVWSWKG